MREKQSRSGQAKKKKKHCIYYESILEIHFHFTAILSDLIKTCLYEPRANAQEMAVEEASLPPLL